MVPVLKEIEEIKVAYGSASSPTTEDTRAMTLKQTVKNRRYILVPGRVVSISDGKEHFISALRLMELYDLRISQVLVWEKDFNLMDKVTFAEMHPDKIWLYPVPDGNYRGYLNMLETRVFNQLGT